MKSLLVMACMGMLFGCADSKENAENDSKKVYQPSASQPLSFADIPNPQTTYEVIETNNIDEDDALMTHLQMQLLKDQFDLFEKESGNSWSENDCDTNKVVQIKGEGIRSYRAVSQIKIGDDKKTRPDFILLVFSFDSDVLAQQYFKTLDSAVGSGHGLCNGKAPEELVLHGREIYYLTTRAEMFKPYIERYANIIRQFKVEQEHRSDDKHVISAG